jgi:chorismate mutase
MFLGLHIIYPKIMKNQPNKTISKELAIFRDQIDNIDDQIISLLSKRMEVVTKVGEHKKANNEGFFVRSNREADMIKALIKKADKSIPQSTIIHIWRKIITSANITEQNLKIGVHNPGKSPEYNHLIREYYSDLVPINTYDSTTNLILALEKKEVQIGIFSLPKISDHSNSDNWWINLANNSSNINIFTRIPFFELQQDDGVAKLVAVAAKDPEKSEEDRTLMMVEIDSHIGRSQILDGLKNANFDGRILKQSNLSQIDNISFYLIEVEGFYVQDDPEIAKFTKDRINPYIKVIGHYPTLIKLN